jgi:hypothetical protein
MTGLLTWECNSICNIPKLTVTIGIEVESRQRVGIMEMERGIGKLDWYVRNSSFVFAATLCSNNINNLKIFFGGSARNTVRLIQQNVEADWEGGNN